MEISFDYIKEHCKTIGDVLELEKQWRAIELTKQQEDLVLMRENE